MTPELTAASARYAIAEMLLSGITTFADMYYFEEEIAAVCEEMKVRALVGETIIEMPTCNSKNASESLAYCESMLLKWRDHPLITPIIAPHAPNTNSEATLRKVVALSQKYHAPIMMHVAEMTYELDYFEENYRQTPIAFLSELGFLKRPFIMAHCILANEQDLALLADSDARVAHCIAANTKSAKGVAPIKELLAEKIPVGLGTDGPSSGNTLELFTQMRLFADFHKTKNQDRSLFPAKEIVRLATCGGAEVLGLQEQIGSIVVGKKADLVLVETEAVNMFPIYDPYAALVYSANAGNVSSVWVNGRCLVKEKQLLSAKISVLRQQLAEQMGTFRQKAAELTDGTISV